MGTLINESTNSTRLEFDEVFLQGDRSKGYHGRGKRTTYIIRAVNSRRKFLILCLDEVQSLHDDIMSVPVFNVICCHVIGGFSDYLVIVLVLRILS